MAVCHHYRIPHSQFLSWPADDRDKAIAYYVRERSRCGTCGTRPEEWDEARGGDRHAYYAVERWCGGCAQIEAMRASMPGDTGRGIKISLKPVARAEEVSRDAGSADP
ncbi:hypothetical protein MF672_010890 [Actinomadura sp. ATCC 31491]|uniref:Uncharacterized protein n=1 Tax=Actinomadura luzonensis TaxID=2805427 RepID=A0ABT0FQ83_9ACTN|nr:hypothetical protein [Actinomadura luzonensis]MCK2214293.1 hypothetical protein [Actinomadura luzonensis]